MAFPSSGSLLTDRRETAISETWETQTDWEAYQSISSIEITNGTLQLAEVTIPDGDIHRYTFEDNTSSSTLEDSIGTQDGSIPLSGMSFVQNGAPEGSYYGDFSRGDTVTGLRTATSTGAFTIVAYVNRNTTGNRDDFFQVNSNNDLLIRANTSNLEMAVVGQSNYQSSLSVPNDEWVSIAIAWNGSDSVNFGVGTNTENVSNQGNSDTQDREITIASGGNNYGGQMDDVIVFNRQLTENEIQNLAGR